MAKRERDSGVKHGEKKDIKWKREINVKMNWGKIM